MTAKPGSPKGLPLSEASFLIMLSLSSEPKHGYAIMIDVRRLSQERVRLSTGTLYGALKRMLDQGWIESVVEEGGSKGADVPARGRKTYALTPYGRRVLKAEAKRIEKLAEVARLHTTGAEA